MTVSQTTRYQAALGNNSLKVQLAPGAYNDRYSYLVGSNLSPQTLTSIFNDADAGYLYRYADLLEECRQRDLHLQSVLGKRESAVSGAEYEFRAPLKSGKRGEAIAQWCKLRIEEVVAEEDLDLNFTDLLNHLMRGIFQGRSGVEAVYRNEGKWWLPDRWSFLHSRRFSYSVDWRLHIWDAGGSQTDIYGTKGDSPFSRFPGIPISAFPKGKFIVHRPSIYGTYPTREGLGRGLCLFSMFKRFAIRDWLAFAEWAGRGLRTGKYASGADGKDKASPDDKDALQEALEKISSSVIAVYPDTTDIDIKDAPSNNDCHDQLVTMVNLELSKGVLGETLTTEVGKTGGNRALGDIHQNESAKLSINDSKALAATIYRDLLRPLVRMNFGMNAPVPQIVFGCAPKEDKDAYTKRVVDLVNIGLEVDQKDVRNTVGIEDPTPGAKLLGKPVAEQTPSAKNPASTIDNPQQDSQVTQK